MNRPWHLVYKKDSGDIVCSCSGDSSHYLKNIIQPQLDADSNLACADVTEIIEETLPGASRLDSVLPHETLKTIGINYKYDAVQKRIVAK